MLTSCAIVLKVRQEVLVPPSLGQVLHAFFLNQVRNLDAGLAEELHASSSIKPFTLSPLWGKVAFEDNRWRLFPGEEYTFRVTSIAPDLSSWLQEKAGELIPPGVELAGARLDVDSWTFDAQENPWAGTTSYAEIYNSIVSSPKAGNRIQLKFLSPTTFRSGGRNYPLPDPQKVFLNLLQKWNRYSPVNLGDNYIKFIEENVFPSGYGLQTRIMHFDRYKQVGFTGSCTFGVRQQNDDIMVKVLHMPADYTFYAGVGYKTTMGMGQAKAVYKIRQCRTGRSEPR